MAFLSLGNRNRAMSTKSKLVPRPKSSSSREEEEMRRAAARDASKTTDPLVKVRLLCLARGCNGIYLLGKRFRIMDNDGSWNINADEFSTGIREISDDKITDQELMQMYDTMDRNEDGKISYNEFLRGMRPPLNDLRLELVQLAFEKMDKTGDGKITYDDIKGAYTAKGHPQVLSGQTTEKEMLTKFLHVFESDPCAPDEEPTGDGVVTWEEFLNYYSGVSASIDDDPYFDLMMRQAWKLS